MNGYKVSTSWSEDLIKSKVTYENYFSKRIDKISEKIISLQDEGIRKALIDLGWTPPKDKKIVR